MQDAASAVPPGVDREQMLLPIARNGIGDVADVVKQSNSELNMIGGRIRAIGNEYQALGGPKKQSPTTTTTSPTPDPPQCKPEDIAKLQKKVDDWNKKDQDLTKRINVYNKQYPPNHLFDMRDPKQAAEWARGQALMREREDLMKERTNITMDILQCGGKILDNGGIQWPDGSTTPTPSPTPTPNPPG